MSSLPVTNPHSDIVTNSFYITYVLLITTGTITFIEALRTANPMLRHIFNLETCISIVAAYFYGKFIEMRNNMSDDQYKEISTVRYTDWAITTPMMLLALGLAITFNNKTSLPFLTYVVMVLLNAGMLIFGYLGETGRLDKNKSIAIGFVFFIGLVAYAWVSLMAGHTNRLANVVIFLIFFGIWTLYGVVANMDEVTKNVSYNILDAFAKCFVGIGFWAYFTALFK